jgi:UDP-N-acetylglucosamine 2-epimerase (non-hydrolysing)
MKNKLPILICFGTRPEWLKVKPLIKLMNRDEYQLLFTGQHEDLLKSVEVDYKITINNSDNRLDSIISDCMLQFPTGDFRGVLVQGDTGSAFGCAIAAFNRQIKIYYLEAGLRSGSMRHPYPEEGYRQMIARISNINFAPTELSYSNLVNEAVMGEIFEVGNTVLDNLINLPESKYGTKVLITMHRRENHHLMAEWFTEINDLAIAYPNLEFIIPIHPNPNVQVHKHLLTNVKVVEPLSHNETINILLECKLVISDSGGIQEEATFFNKKVIVCRTTTERPEGIATGHLHLCKTPNELKDLFGRLEENSYICKPCPYGDGRAAQKIKKILDAEEL